MPWSHPDLFLNQNFGTVHGLQFVSKIIRFLALSMLRSATNFAAVEVPLTGFVRQELRYLRYLQFVVLVFVFDFI